jgi:site-specific DNA-methyltransferase (adenine-specific)
VAEIFITQSSEPGDVVCDPFMGSGSVGVAALRAGRRFLGNDLNAEAVRIAAVRLQDFGEGRVPDGLPEEVVPPQADLFETVNEDRLRR